MNNPIIVAGAGFWGCTIARLLADVGKKVIVLEARRDIGGNCRCRTINGIEVHLYGSHIFHTSNENAWRFVNRFSKFNQYRHKVLAKHNDKEFHLPIGKTLLEEFFGISMKDRKLQDFLTQPSDLDAKPSTRTNGDIIFDAFIRGYTSKQWGISPEQVAPSVLSRLKVRDSYNTDYFDDDHQGVPSDGYNALFREMLNHPNISLHCNHTFTLRGNLPETTVYYSGPLDRLFEYRFGALPWRSLRFETERLAQHNFQGNSVVNYPDANVPYTRIHEFRHYHTEKVGPFAHPQGTIITREYPTAWRCGLEPYYPINNDNSATLLERYQSEVVRLNMESSHSGFKLIAGGRLGAYKYYDMGQAIAAAMACVDATL